MLLGNIQQQPAERLSYTISYAKALSESDTVDTAVVEVEPEGLVIDPVAAFEDRVRIWISGGESPVRYKVTLQATTVEGRVYEDELYVAIREL